MNDEAYWSAVADADLSPTFVRLIHLDALVDDAPLPERTKSAREEASRRYEELSSLAREMRRRGLHDEAFALLSHADTQIRRAAASHFYFTYPEWSHAAKNSINYGLPVQEALERCRNVKNGWKGPNLKKSTVEQLVARFADAVQRYEDVRLLEVSDDPKDPWNVATANKCIDEKNEVKSELRQRGQLKVLTDLFRHPNPLVRLYAALGLLGSAPDIAIPQILWLKANTEAHRKVTCIENILENYIKLLNLVIQETSKQMHRAEHAPGRGPVIRLPYHGGDPAQNQASP